MTNVEQIDDGRERPTGREGDGGGEAEEDREGSSVRHRVQVIPVIGRSIGISRHVCASATVYVCPCDARAIVWVDEVCFDVCPHARYSRSFDAVVSEFETRETLP